jgi:dephospho-CoA kinase
MAIVSVSGKIGSGKDTVASIWNDLYPMQQCQNKKRSEDHTSELQSHGTDAKIA